MSSSDVCFRDSVTISMMQLSFRKVAVPSPALVTYEKQLLPDPQATFNRLEKSIVYASPEETKLWISGRYIDVPRQMVSFGLNHESIPQYYNTAKPRALEEQPELLRIKELVDARVQAQAVELGLEPPPVSDLVLVNRYANGKHHIGWHSDKQTGHHPVASVSLGQERDFAFRLIPGTSSSCKAPPTLKMTLESNSLLIMWPPTNSVLEHRLPPRATSKCSNPRINLTFRFTDRQTVFRKRKRQSQ